MPTENPRVNVTLRPHQYELLSRLSKAQGRSRSAVLVELLEMVTPVLERVVVVVEAASRAQTQARLGFIKSAEQAEAAILPHVQAALGQFDWLISEAETAAHTPTASAPLAEGEGRKGAQPPRPRRSPKPHGRRGKDPRPVTRGSGHKPKGGQNKRQRGVRA
jgi:hypothetical protein